MNEFEALRFQANIENIKEHVRNALAGHEEEYYIGSYNAERWKCSACRAWNDWSHPIDHEKGCEFVRQEESKGILREWVNA